MFSTPTLTIGKNETALEKAEFESSKIINDFI